MIPHTPEYVRALSKFLSACTRREYPRGHAIYTPQRPTGRLGLLVNGTVNLVADDSGLDDVVLGTRYAWDFIGEHALFDTPVNYYVRPRERCDIAEFPLGSYMDFVVEHPELALALGAQMVTNFSELTETFVDTSTRNVEDRVYRHLSRLAKGPGADPHPDGAQVKVSRRELAASLGCSREMVGKSITNLDEKRLVRKAEHSHQVVVLGRR